MIATIIEKSWHIYAKNIQSNSLFWNKQNFQNQLFNVANVIFGFAQAGFHFEASQLGLWLVEGLENIWNPCKEKDLEEHLISDCAEFKDHSFVLELLHECFNLDILATDFGFGGSSIYSKLPHITKARLFSNIYIQRIINHIISTIWYSKII